MFGLFVRQPGWLHKKNIKVFTQTMEEAEEAVEALARELPTGSLVIIKYTSSSGPNLNFSGNVSNRGTYRVEDGFPILVGKGRGITTDWGPFWDMSKEEKEELSKELEERSKIGVLASGLVSLSPEEKEEAIKKYREQARQIEEGETKKSLPSALNFLKYYDEERALQSAQLTKAEAETESILPNRYPKLVEESRKKWREEKR